MRTILMILVVALAIPSDAFAAELSAVVQKPKVDVYGQASFDAPKLVSLERNATVTIAAQNGLWYEVRTATGESGFLRVNDVRISAGASEDEGSNLRTLTTGKAGVGRVTETAGVRGIDESDLKSAVFSQAQLDAMVANRLAAEAAAAYAGEQRWEVTPVAFARELSPKASSAPGGDVLGRAKGLLNSLGSGLGSAVGVAGKAIPKAESEQLAEELALGPQIAGRVLGARPLWNDAAAQKRVNLIGRWVASQTSRPDLPWTFGVIDSPEINAFAAPGGYVLVTRGLYEILSSDAEVAAVLGHEISHCVQRDHYNVIRKQEVASAGKDIAVSEVKVGTDSVAGTYARKYVEENGAAIMLSSLDRGAEFQADEASSIYLARAGMNPLAYYSVLQKMSVPASGSPGLAQLYKTHPALVDRMDRLDKREDEELKAYTMRE